MRTEDTSLVIRRKVLVVDDYEDQAQSLGMLLSILGHETRLAFDGPTALEAARAFRPDVALIDLGIPELNGYEVARRIRELPQLDGTVLVAQTGWGHKDDRTRSRDAGFDHHLIKPIDIGELQRILMVGPHLVETENRDRKAHPAGHPARHEHRV